MIRGEVAVSVILPTYNRAELLPRSIQTVLDQTYGDFELIVVDDGSEDETGKVAREGGAEVLRHHRFGGAASRRVRRHEPALPVGLVVQPGLLRGPLGRLPVLTPP